MANKLTKPEFILENVAEVNKIIFAEGYMNLYKELGDSQYACIAISMIDAMYEEYELAFEK